MILLPVSNKSIMNQAINKGERAQKDLTLI